METVSEEPMGPSADWNPHHAGPPVDEIEVQRLAETFAVTPRAARQAMARVGSDLRALQRELGGRR